MIRCFHILLRRINEKIYLKALRKRNKNHSPSIICNNCIAGVIYHNLGLKFTSPTINLYIPGEDYLNFVRYIKEYQNAALIEIDSDKPFPVGQLCLNGYPKVSVFFQHYTNFNEAKKKWYERYQRVNFKNLYVIWEFWDNLYSTDLLREFDKMPLKKVALTHKYIPGIKHQYVLPSSQIGASLEYAGISGRRNLDEFDYIAFLGN